MAVTKNLIFGSPGQEAVPIGSPRMKKPEVGFDTMQQRYLVECADAALPARMDALFAKGSGHGTFGTMYVVDHSLAGGGGDLWEVDVDFKGLLSSKPYKRRETSYAEQSSGSNIAMSASLQAQGYPAVAARVQAMQAALSCVTSYVTTTKPASSRVGKEVELIDLPVGYPAFPAPPAGIWDYITEPTWVYPKGWVLDRSDPEGIAGAGIWFVVDYHVFHQQKTM